MALKFHCSLKDYNNAWDLSWRVPSGWYVVTRIEGHDDSKTVATKLRELAIGIESVGDEAVYGG